jgi:hypothetical protein
MSAVDPKARGFDKAQLVTVDGNRQVIKILNPLKYSFDGLPPAGTVLPGAEDGVLPGTAANPAWVILTIDPDGNVQGRLMNRPGGYGTWQYVTVLNGMVAIHPDDQLQRGVAFFFCCA